MKSNIPRWWYTTAAKWIAHKSRVGRQDARALDNNKHSPCPFVCQSWAQRCSEVRRAPILHILSFCSTHFLLTGVLPTHIKWVSVYFNRAEIDNKRASCQEREPFNVAKRRRHRLVRLSQSRPRESWNLRDYDRGLPKCTQTSCCWPSLRTSSRIQNWNQ
jgi:hypothetical protein